MNSSASGLAVNFHKELLESGRWNAMSVIEQMGNIGSEVWRAISAKDSGDVGKFDEAVRRMCELYDMTAADPKGRSAPALREVLRSREVVMEFLFWKNSYGETAESIDRYFLAYGVMANDERRARIIASRKAW